MGEIRDDEIKDIQKSLEFLKRAVADLEQLLYQIIATID